MFVLNNLIAPSNTGFFAEPQINHGFVCDFGGFHVEYTNDFRRSNFLLFSEKLIYFYSYEDHGKGQYVVEDGGNRFVLEGSKLRPLANEDFVQLHRRNQGEMYIVERIGRWKYKFIGIDTGKEAVFEKRGYRFVSEKNGKLYFKKLNIPKKIVELDSEFNETRCFEFEGQGFGSLQCVDSYFFIELMGTPQYLRVFDLNKFELLNQKIEIKAAFIQAFRLNSIVHIFAGDELFLWNGNTLRRHSFEQKISGFLVKEEFIYIGFKKDPNLYAYEPGTLKLLEKKQIGVEGYHPWTFARSGSHNVVTLQNSSLPYISRYEYMATWSDDEFFSSEPWEVKVELPIFNESKSPDGENFTLNIRVSSDDNYIKQVRQSMAIVDDAVSRHAVSIVPSSKERPYSKGFNGKVEVVFEKAKKLNEEQRSQLVQGMEKIQKDYEVAFKGFANGNVQPIDIKVEFKD